MIRVLQVIDRLKHVSGIARSILNYYEYIDTEKVQFDFLVVDSDPDIVESVEAKGGKVYTIQKLGITNAFEVKNEIKEFFEKNKNCYQVVHSSFFHIDFILFPIAKKSGVKVCISHSHNTRYSDYWTRSVRNLMLSKLSLMNATHFVACSRMAGAFQFGSKRITEGRVFVINNAIDAAAFTYDEEIRALTRKNLCIEDKYVIGNVGRFNKQKNHTYLFEVFSAYAKEDDNAVLLLVGEGELMEQFKQLAQEKGIDDKAFFLGVRKDVPALLQAMDCYVFPSLYEGLGISLVEAQAAGLPCVAASTIPLESKVTDNVVYLNFDETQVWLEQIKKYKSHIRKDTFSSLVDSGYEIKSAAKNLEEYYLACIEGANYNAKRHYR